MLLDAQTCLNNKSGWLRVKKHRFDMPSCGSSTSAQAFVVTRKPYAAHRLTQISNARAMIRDMAVFPKHRAAYPLGNVDQTAIHDELMLTMPLQETVHGMQWSEE